MPFGIIPKVTKKELESCLLKNFNFGKLLSYKKLKKGFANSLYYIKTQKGDYVFKIAMRHNSEKINYEIKLLNSLRNLPVPKPIETKTNKYIFNYKGHRTFIYKFLQGKEEKKFTTKMLFETGKFLGNLHLQSKNFESSIKRTEYYLVSKARLIRVAREIHNIRNIKIKKAFSYLRVNVLKYNLPISLPKGAIHMDMKPENVLFKNGYLSGVIDFDNSYTGPLIFDLADTLMWFCSKNGNFDIDAAKAIYSGYKSVKKITQQEKRVFLDALHNVFLAITLCGIDLLINKKLPKDFIIWVIDNLLETEKNLKITKMQFQKMFK